MKDKNLTYSEALQLVTERMKKLDNLHSFCVNHDINYNVALSIKNGKAKRPYPLMILKFLKAFKFKAEMKKEVYYLIKNS